MNGIQLTGKTVVVSGSSGPLGRALVESLATAGARVIAADATEPISPLPRQATFHELDVASQASWTALAEDVRLSDGEVHGLVNTAVLACPDRLADVTLDDWNHAIDVNVAGPIYGVQAFHGLMPPGSSIVNVGSSTAFTGYPAVADTAAMWALRGLTHAANLELGGRGIRVNAVHPGFRDDQETSLHPGFADVALSLTTLNRLASVDDVSALVTFLLSDASSYIAGAEIPVDGGATSHAGAKLARSGMSRS